MPNVPGEPGKSWQVLTAPACVMDKPNRRPLLQHSPIQRLADQPASHSLTHRKAHSFTGKYILETG